MEAQRMVYPDIETPIECQIKMFSSFVNGNNIVHKLNTEDRSEIKIEKELVNKQGVFFTLSFSENFIKKYGNKAIEKICRMRAIL